MIIGVVNEVELLLAGASIYAPPRNVETWTSPTSCIPGRQLEAYFSLLRPLSGPLHMSPVVRAGSVSKNSPRHSFLYKKFDVFMRRRAGPFTEISVSATKISVTELEIFPI